MLHLTLLSVCFEYRYNLDLLGLGLRKGVSKQVIQSVFQSQSLSSVYVTESKASTASMASISSISSQSGASASQASASQAAQASLSALSVQSVQSVKSAQQPDVRLNSFHSIYVFADPLFNSQLAHRLMRLPAQAQPQPRPRHRRINKHSFIFLLVLPFFINLLSCHGLYTHIPIREFDCCFYFFATTNCSLGPPYDNTITLSRSICPSY